MCLLQVNVCSNGMHLCVQIEWVVCPVQCVCATHSTRDVVGVPRARAVSPLQVAPPDKHVASVCPVHCCYFCVRSREKK